MQHDLSNKYGDVKSIIHGIDPRIKTLSLIFFIFLVVSTPADEGSRFSTYFLLISSVVILSRVPLSFVFRRSLTVIPFVLLVFLSLPFIQGGEVMASYDLRFLQLNVTHRGLETLIGVFAKSYLSVLSMIVLTSTTPFPRLIRGFESLKMPKIMVLTISFMCRYMTVLVDETMRMKRARDLRSSGGNRRWHIETVGDIIGNLFIRSYGRGERIYNAMLSRGFTGSIKTLDDFKIRALDGIFAAFFIAAAVVVRFI
ncbi:MAG: cobalt ECF transporter T component CbiQ [Candidatus Altiarchaeota archaeon]|nr:cobalt ECF transporter T component CbiQ [Candidatus Altiarchaeota archaeon]